MSLSIALCTHNGAAFIEEQLRSICDQTLPPDEIVVSDDASTDGTTDLIGAVFRSWQGEHPGQHIDLRILCNETPLGVTSNFEQALAACTGDLIALSDQDDVWQPARLEIMVAEFKRRPELGLLHSDARLVDAAGAPFGQTLLAALGVSSSNRAEVHDGGAFGVLLRRNIVTGATTILRREVVERSRPFPESWVHDEWLAMVAAATSGVDLIEVPLVDYRQHSGNQIGASSLDAAGKLGRLSAPRTARNQRLLARAEALHSRAPGFTPQPSAENLRLIDAKLAHERVRSALPAARLRRMRPIVLELWSGRYHRYGLGLHDVLRDLVQPV